MPAIILFSCIWHTFFSQLDCEDIAREREQERALVVHTDVHTAALRGISVGFVALPRHYRAREWFAHAQ